MSVCRQVCAQQGDVFNARRLSDLNARRLPTRIDGSRVPDRRPAAQVWEREIRGSVSAILRAEQREQRLVLIDRQQLTVA